MTTAEILPPPSPRLAHPGTPLREAITSSCRRPEAEALAPLIPAATFDEAALGRIRARAGSLVARVRAERAGSSGVDALMSEFDLSAGVAKTATRAAASSAVSEVLYRRFKAMGSSSVARRRANRIVYVTETLVSTLMSSSLQRIYRRLRFGKPIVVVSGLPRSGTSMIMKMLEAGGMPVVAHDLRAADEENPLGYLEDQRVKGLAGSDKRWLHDVRGKAVKVISHLLKELPPHHNYRVLLVRRAIGEVLASQAKMLARRGEPSGPGNDQMAELLERDLWRARYLLAHGRQFDVLELHYARART